MSSAIRLWQHSSGARNALSQEPNVFPLSARDQLLKLRSEGKDDDASRTRLVVDLIASMTETQALETYQKLTGLMPGSGLDLLRQLRKEIGVVLQEPFLFSGSIRQNLSFNDPSLPFERIVEGAQLAAIHDEIASMPMAYETIIAEGGSALSGGQRQRLALARALTRRPPLLLLDEATSHLDAVTEALINRHLDQLASTRIIIAHRLSTVRHADLIVVMDEGRIVEQGTHEELLARCGRYAELARSQMSDE